MSWRHAAERVVDDDIPHEFRNSDDRLMGMGKNKNGRRVMKGGTGNEYFVFLFLIRRVKKRERERERERSEHNRVEII